MSHDEPPQHRLEGFPQSVMGFFRALESNRREVAARFGLSEIELRALFRVAEAGHVTPKDLAGTLFVTTGAVTGVTDRLIQSGLIKRIAHPADRRSILLELTPAGDDVMTRMHIDFIGMLLSASAAVKESERPMIERALRTMTHRMSQDSR